jgi:hypothetical protein
MEKTAEQVASAHLAWPTVADDPQIGGWIRRLQPERPVRPMRVVVLGIDPQDLLEVASAHEQEPVQAPSADGPDPTLRVGVRVGACTGVSSTAAPSAPNT